MICLCRTLEIQDQNKLSFYLEKYLCKGSWNSLWRSREKVANFKHAHIPDFIGNKQAKSSVDVT